MIAFFGQGGLGNQLFQYATARNLSRRLGEELVLDPWWFAHPLPGETARQLELLKYNVRLREATDDQQRRWRFMRGRWARRFPFLCPMNLVREQSGTYNAAIEHAPAHSYLVGFWQSERYFKDIRTALLEELTPIAPPSAQDAAVLESIERARNAVCVHVRRGDYVSSSSAAAYHGICSIEYYQRALAYIASRVEDATLFIFSDDPAWTRENLRTDFPSHYVAHNSPADAVQDLRLMSRCRHHVIANSSFSWWGAWLSSCVDKIVVAPQAWFLASQATADLVPQEWVRL